MLKNILARSGIVVFFVMSFEVLIMISPFAFFFYSVFNPVFHWVDSYAATRWLTHFFLPHMILPSTITLKMIRILGSVFFVLGSLTFVVCALQVYLGKIFKRGIADKGLYRIIRHPQYFALGIWSIGMVILWSRFIVLVTLSLMLILYYYLAKDEERRMTRKYAQGYKDYMKRTGMFFPAAIEKRLTPKLKSNILKNALVTVSIPLIVIGAGFICRAITLDSIHVGVKDNIAVVSIMPQDSEFNELIINSTENNNLDFIDKEKDYLGYVMPVDYVMQGMLADTGAEHHLFARHQTINMITDWVLHPFQHLTRPPSDMMAKMHHVDPKMARRHHCSLNINRKNMDCSNCPYRRVIFIEVGSDSHNVFTGKNAFALNTNRIPAGFIDLDVRNGKILDEHKVGTKTAWGDVPTPEI